MCKIFLTCFKKIVLISLYKYVEIQFKLKEIKYIIYIIVYFMVHVFCKIL